MEKPTVLNNVETLANVAQIIINGGKWYADIGTETSKGTKVFALSGKVNNIGLVEIPMGTPLREVIYATGGGIPDGKSLRPFNWEALQEAAFHPTCLTR